MKKKLIKVVFLITMILPMFFNFYNVEAYSGVLDPEGYINFSGMITVNDGMGTGTIGLSSNASGYSLAYQKVDLTEGLFNSIGNKYSELNNYVEECKTTLQTKKTALETLKNEWENLKNSETATEEQITEAKNNYDSAVEEYNQLADSYKTNIENLQKDFYELIPNYKANWTETTITNNNVKLDFRNYSGKVYFVLWAKITNGTNTYYDANMYGTDIINEETITISKTFANIKVDETLQLTATSSKNSNITWISSDSNVATVSSDGLVKGIKEGTAVITAKGNSKTATCTITVGSKTSTETNDGEWTDFSNAKFELIKDENNNAKLQITNVTAKDGHSYYIFINSNGSQPDVSSDKNKLELDYKSEKGIFETYYDSIATYIEVNQDLYVSILEEKDYKTKKVVLYGKKIERYAEPKYSDAFRATFMSYDDTQLVTNFTHAKENNRNIQIKVGKITDTSILKKIKNKESSGFADLLTFAKTNKGIYNENLAARKDYDNIAYMAGKSYNNGNSAINLSGLQDGEYYFLYIEAYDDNGKYISQEAVTLAQAQTYNDGSWFLHFYGKDEFKWADFGEAEGGDSTQAPVQLPNTGIGKYIAIISILSVVVIASYIQVKKLKEIE